MDKLRAPAVPLVLVDPYLSVWSFADHLYDDATRHWTGARNNLLGMVKIDGQFYKFMGSVQSDGVFPYEPAVIAQTGVTVGPLQTRYTFENAQIALAVTFMTPLLPDDLKLASRPVSYVGYEMRALDGKEHEAEVYIGASAEIAVENVGQSVGISRYEHGIRCGRGDRDVLTKSGDRLRIDWGYLHLFSCGHETLCLSTAQAERFFVKNRPEQDTDFEGEIPVCAQTPLLLLRKTYAVSDKSVEDFVCVGYDDIHSIQYFGRNIDAYYKKDGDTFEDARKMALLQYEAIRQRACEFDAALIQKAEKLGKKYADIVSLAYRQAFAAHKLTWDGEEAQFFSKECFSNGCIGTVDVSYPSIPLFLLYNPDLVCAMVNPVFKYAASGKWPYEFAPHDVGQYPLANGQVYGLNRQSGEFLAEKQMPVEECGNMLIIVCAICRFKGDAAYFVRHRKLLKQWADYLISQGLDPANQLCTDDFAGRSARNSNLSAKAIVAIGCYGALLNMCGEDGGRYLDLARGFAGEWKEKAQGGSCYKLTFDMADSWSIKYNLVWDKIFGLNLFDEDIYKTEIDCYKQHMHKYGLPLDSRGTGTKSDWQMWSTRLSDDKAYFDMIVGAMWDMLNETPSRVPFCDWYDASTGKQRNFQNRTVQGGLFINLL